MFSRTTRVLLVVALLAVGAYFVFNRSPDGPSSDDTSRLVDSDLARIDRLVLQRETDTLRFARKDSVWAMTEPVEDRAEPAAIASLLDALEHARVERDLGATDDPAQFGLAPAQVRIIALAGADTVVDVALGKRTVDDAWCYARSGSNGNLVLVPTDIARGASLPRDTYRDHRVVVFQLRDVAWYFLAGDTHSTAWKRLEGGWAHVKGDTVAGDSVAVESVLRRLRGLRAVSFVRAAEVRVKRNTYLGKLSLFSIERPIADIAFYHTAEGQTAAVENLRSRAVVIDEDVSDLFEHTTTSLRDRRLVQFSPPDAERIAVVLPDVQGEIVRAGGAWSFPNPAMGRVDPERAAEFVRALRALKWSEVAPARAHLDAARFSVTVTGVGGTILDQMRAAPRPDGSLLVTSRSTRGTWTIDRESLTALAATFARLKPP